eukprot:RCo039275
MTSQGFVRDPYSEAGIIYFDLVSGRKDAVAAPPAMSPQEPVQPTTGLHVPAAAGGDIFIPIPHRLSQAFEPLPGVVLPVVISVATVAGTHASASAQPAPTSTPIHEMEPWPCPHVLEWKRLRWKKGISCYFCLHCGARWKGSGYFLQFMTRENGGLLETSKLI